jgi:hypothetical protein
MTRDEDDSLTLCIDKVPLQTGGQNYGRPFL